MFRDLSIEGREPLVVASVAVAASSPTVKEGARNAGTSRLSLTVGLPPRCPKQKGRASFEARPRVNYGNCLELEPHRPLYLALTEESAAGLGRGQKSCVEVQDRSLRRTDRM